MYTRPEEALCSGAAVSHHTPLPFKDNYPSSSPLSAVSPLAGSPVITALLEAWHPRKHRPFRALMESALPFPSLQQLLESVPPQARPPLCWEGGLLGETGAGLMPGTHERGHLAHQQNSFICGTQAGSG